MVRVRDTGAGIAAEQLGRIFEMFAQVDTQLEGSHSGLGIGLTLAKTLVEMHGGTVEACSAGVGQGSSLSGCLWSPGCRPWRKSHPLANQRRRGFVRRRGTKT